MNANEPIDEPPRTFDIDEPGSGSLAHSHFSATRSTYPPPETMKASLNGPNRRRNRAGDRSEPTFSTCSFLIKPLEELDAIAGATAAPGSSLQKLLAGLGNACLFTTHGQAGQDLMKWHASMVGEQQGGPMHVHFHDVAVFVLSAVPLPSSALDEDEQSQSQPQQRQQADIMYLSRLQCHNNKVCTDSIMGVTCCSRPSCDSPEDYPSLSAVGIEVYLRRHRQILTLSTEEEDVPIIKAKDVCRRLMNHTENSVLSVNENILISLDHLELACRVSEVRVAKKESSTASAMADITMDEPYRGRVTMQSEFFVSASDVNAITVEGAKKIPKGQLPADIVHITTSDGEWFPVRRAMLAPCIKLTKYVQAGRGKYKDIPMLSDEERSEDAPTNDGCPHAKIPIACCEFDRVLLFIASTLFPEQKFTLDLSEVNVLADAAESLGLQSLADLCGSQSSSFDSRVRKDKYIRLAEVVERNNENHELLIILDGMVLDITRWIDEHPGGASIIPTQALNIDCTVFFEMYHVSRQSFLYLKQFYIGELAPEDCATLRSSAKGVDASQGFLDAIRSYTMEWRVQVKEDQGSKVHKSL